MATLADGDRREQMDTGHLISNIFLIFSTLIISFSATTILNSVLIVGGIAVAVGTSWYV